MPINQKNLFVVAVPIGNIGDISKRAISCLSSADYIIAENPSQTAKLLEILNVNKPQLLKIAEFHNSQEIFNKLESVSGDIVYVSDAGTPNLSDPGGQLVEVARSLGFKITGVPGPSALSYIISICGFPAVPMTFFGFPPTKKGRNKYFQKVAETDHLIVLFESKHRILKTLSELPQKREICLGRELTKLHEEIIWGDADLVKENLKSTKGEFVIAISPVNYGK
jgi:16S rRNA (cytidine1402-2'-O)-methyltransferase